MAIVRVEPMPDGIARLPARLRPQHPPIFDDSIGPITEADRAFARALFAALAPEDRDWYRTSSTLGAELALLDVQQADA